MISQFLSAIFQKVYAVNENHVMGILSNIPLKNMDYYVDLKHFLFNPKKAKEPWFQYLKLRAGELIKWTKQFFKCKHLSLRFNNY